MKTAKKVIIASAVAAVIGSAAATTSFADRGSRDWKNHHGARHMGESGRGFRHHGAKGGMRLLDNFDSNDDGKVTQDEIDNARNERFARFDTDQNGSLDLQEYQALWLDAMRERMVDRFQALDNDGDALVTNEEFLARFSKLISRLDRNDDGEITRDEMRQRHRQGHRQDDDSE